MARRRKRKPIPQESITVTIESMSHEGRGIAHHQGKTIFVDSALPGEEVVMKYASVRGKFDEGYAIEIVSPSPDRVEPPCEFFELCGGCSLQHMATDSQIKFKQGILAEHFAHFGKIEPEEWLEPMQQDTLGYRSKARLGVRYVSKKESCLVGFREKRSSFLAEIEACEVLIPKVSQLIMSLRAMIGSMDAKQSTPQIELAAGDEQLAFVVRHMEAMTESDRQKWIEFAMEHEIQLYFQPKGPTTVHKVWPDDQLERLYYELPDFKVKLAFHPLDFTQVNTSINRQMVTKAIELLDPQPNERVLDLFCGLGNFTIPLATKAQQVIGVEGVDTMVKRGYENAKLNNLESVEFYQADLQQDFSDKPWAKEGFDKILIDPPRSGALDVVNYLPKFGAKRIVYVSCNPATLARDAGVMKEHGYRLVKAGVMDMFPHTAHVESMAVFERV
ncbi:23S rRNA (uracil(1939)-C(5))-methyltransferase RlmD [Pleionea litopenaei]|uniref:23S rRNA (uracil(1939)-C(5))-methyltransferase RlmD n=1 Tax=Pleionea litopenaei TaxID=3070815 RepID=A0AA51RVX4_9GAMM|nr:23S rRNA (uracil(1939)-C(5))-methyltransferase RlmD [Pleionea sp. HL-JVS1]WMS88545.1 23S rRNA (uracil(1939)-C(5))-methyltransferase RlmD [Pleionea sp. HL-JVS1]